MQAWWKITAYRGHGDGDRLLRVEGGGHQVRGAGDGRVRHDPGSVAAREVVHAPVLERGIVQGPPAGDDRVVGNDAKVGVVLVRELFEADPGRFQERLVGIERNREPDQVFHQVEQGRIPSVGLEDGLVLDQARELPDRRRGPGGCFGAPQFRLLLHSDPRGRFALPVGAEPLRFVAASPPPALAGSPPGRPGTRFRQRRLAALGSMAWLAPVSR